MRASVAASPPNESRAHRRDTGTIVDVLRSYAETLGERPSFTYLLDGEGDVAQLGFAELDRRARAIAVQLRDRAAPGERALLLFDDGIEFITAFCGCLYAGLIAVPAYPPDPFRLERTARRLNAITTDAHPSVVLTTERIVSIRDAIAAHSPRLGRLEWIATDRLSKGDPKRWERPPISPSSVALLQYTSGSTGTPKGVIVSHGNILHNEELIRRAFEHDATSSFVGWLPVFHDMGLIGNVLQPLYMGIHCVLMPPMAFLQRPYRWLQAISRFRATTSGGPNFAYELCCRRVTSEQRASLDLSSWKVAFNGSEHIARETIERFAATFAECGFRPEALYPCYGMAEATLIVTGGRRDERPATLEVDAPALSAGFAREASEGPANRLVASGSVLGDQEVAIVDPKRRVRCGPTAIGEIWVRGASVAQGYWKRARETRETFGALLATGDGPFLRTGDLGFMHGDDLFVVGRIKDVIIIRGRNYYPQDLERTVLETSNVLRPGSGATFSIHQDGEERLVVVQELRADAENLGLDDLVRGIRLKIVAEYQIDVYAVVLIEAGTIPKTTSGKIQRGRCRELFLAGKLSVREEWNRGSLREV